MNNSGSNANNAASLSAAASSVKKRASIKRPSMKGRTTNEVVSNVGRYCQEIMEKAVAEAEKKCKEARAKIEERLEKKASMKKASVKKAKLTAKNHLAALNAKEREYRALMNSHPNMNKANAATRKKLKEIPERLKKIAAKRAELQQRNAEEEEEAVVLAQLDALRASRKKPAAAAAANGAKKKKASQKMSLQNRIKLLQNRVAMNVSANAIPNAKKRASMKGLKTKAEKELPKLIHESFTEARNAKNNKNKN